MTTEAIQTIQCNATYKEILADSFGGVMYDEANREKYSQQSIDWIVSKYSAMSESEKSLAGGVMKGAVDFIKGD